MADEAAPIMPLAPKNAQGIFEIPVDIVGSDTFGRYPRLANPELSI